MKSRRSWEDHRLEEVVKSSQEERNVEKSNIGDNTGDEGKIVGGAIRACGGIGSCICYDDNGTPSELLKSITSTPNNIGSTNKRNGNGVLGDEGLNTKRQLIEEMGEKN
ncbi:hypothetical protein Tco_0191302 [Tanacetum coccineum]